MQGERHTKSPLHASASWPSNTHPTSSLLPPVTRQPREPSVHDETTTRTERIQQRNMVLTDIESIIYLLNMKDNWI